MLINLSKPKILFLAITAIFSQACFSASTDIADIPMAVNNMVNPNVLVVYDNSQSMDAYMNGTLVSGNDPNTRSNIGRTVIRNTITAYRNAFNWGLMSYGVTGNSLNNTYAYYLGSDTGMLFTDDCTGYVAGTPPTPGVSASNGNRRCIANTQPFSGGNYITYDKSGDDVDILDVLYTTGSYTTLWGISPGSGSNYNIYQTHKTASGNSWASGAFTSYLGNWSFTPTDAGYTSQNPPITRQFYVPRGWGYYSNISGYGQLNRAISSDSTTHYNALIALLGNETNSATGEIKNSAVFTPLKGTLQTAKNYFSGNLSGYTSPIKYSCQQNFVMLVTDGLPTGTTSGNLYSETERTNSCAWSTSSNSCTSGAFGTAASDAISAVESLRTTTVSGVSSSNKDGTDSVTGKFDVQTYVVALGDSVANANAVSVMNAMAYKGGTEKSMAASDSTALQNAITKISDDITAKVGAAAAVAVTNAHVTESDNYAYVSSYNSGTWAGDVNSYEIDLTTGATSTTSSWTSGSAATQLDTRTSSNRYIVTSPDTAGATGGIQFQPTTASTTTKLSSAQQTLLNTPSSTDGAAVLAYLRGDRSGETSGTYRVRAHLLGDTVNAEPLLVRKPSANYADTGYSTFKSAYSSRANMLYQGANDGMLHAFVASSGNEAWAYVPNLVMSNLNNLSLKPGFTHKYYVDGTPVSGDVDFKNVASASGSGTDWRTILVGGLGKGGRGYYALDITSPSASSEADVKDKVLWEFPNSISTATARNTAKLNMGYSFGKPLIVKTAAKGWVVLVTSGYNNGTNSGDSGGDGLGHLYVIDPKTGDLIKDISTTGCSSTPTSDPCGLAQISGYVDNTDVDNTVRYVYGGDLKGNLWRFDFTGNSVSSWSVSKFATLKDSSNNTQPITTAPELSLVSISGTDSPMVYVGTGAYLGNSDVPGQTGSNSWSSQTQTIYGLRDNFSTLPTLSSSLRSVLQQQTLTTNGSSRTVSNNTVDYTTINGWYVDLPSTGERINTDPIIAYNVLVFTSNIPSATVCQPGGSSWLYYLNLSTGGLIDNSTSTSSGTFLGNVLASRPVLIQLPSGKVVSLVRTSDAQTIKQDLPLSSSVTSGKRVSWRELFN